jgi:hypothetical protein
LIAWTESCIDGSTPSVYSAGHDGDRRRPGRAGPFDFNSNPEDTS